jgi:hypothetical protein
MDSLKDLTKEKRKEIKEVLRQCLKKEERILFAYLHGSFDEGKPFRDIDIAIFVLESQIQKEKALDFEISLSMKLEEMIKMPVDVKIINYAPLAFQYHSTAGTLLTCKEDDLRVDFLTKMRSLYIDFKPCSGRFLREMLHAE